MEQIRRSVKTLKASSPHTVKPFGDPRVWAMRVRKTEEDSGSNQFWQSDEQWLKTSYLIALSIFEGSGLSSYYTEAQEYAALLKELKIPVEETEQKALALAVVVSEELKRRDERDARHMEDQPCP